MNRLDSWIFEGYPTRTIDLCIYRILYSSRMLLGGVPVALWLRQAPRAFFSPPLGLAALFTRFPPFPLILGLNVLLAVCLAALLVGWNTRTAAVGTSLTLLVLDSFAYSLGKIDHDILLVITPLILATSGWGDSLSIDGLSNPCSTRETVHGSWNLALLALVIGICIFTAGWAKLTTGWLDPSSHAAWGHFVQNYVNGRRPLLADVALRSYSGLFWESIDWFTTLFELGFLLAVFRRGVMLVFMSLACWFHVGTWLLLDITFAWNVIVYGAFVGYSSLVHPRTGEEVVRICSRLLRVTPAWVPLITALLPAIVAIVAGKSIASLLHVPLNQAIDVVGAVCGMVYLTGIPARRRRAHDRRGSLETVAGT